MTARDEATTRDEVFDKPLTYTAMLEVEGEEGSELAERIIYRASGLGSCLGALARSRMGMTPARPSDFMQQKYDEGTEWEERVIAAGLGEDWVQVTLPDHLKLYGTPVQNDTSEVVQVETELAWGNKIIRCHPDAFAIHRETNEVAVVEAKFLSVEFASQKHAGIARAEKDGQHPATGLGDMYAWQVAVEILSTGLPMLYVMGEKELGEEGTEDAGKVVGIKTIQTYFWKESPYTLKEVKARVLEVEGCVARGEMPGCPVPFQYPCGFWAEHEDRGLEEIEDEELGNLVIAYRSLDKMAGQIADNGQKVREDIRRRMGELGIVGGVSHGMKVSLIAPRKGNVSWSQWAKEAMKKWPEVKKLDVEGFRGKEIAEGLRLEDTEK